MKMTPEELEQRKAAANPPKDEASELLEVGQEEVFSRTAVEMGRTEHASEAGRQGGPAPDAIARDEAQTQRQAPPNASPGEVAADASRD
jgi:hypothetical protein